MDINEHLILLSVDEIFQDDRYLLWLNDLNYYSRLLTTIDPTVIIINQIMYTFFRNDIYCTERMKSEQWIWSEYSFTKINKLYTLDYEEDMALMIVSEFLIRLRLMFILTFAYMVISLINGLLVRVAIKCSVLTVFPVIWL